MATTLPLLAGLLLASVCSALDLRAYFRTGGVSGYLLATSPSFNAPGSSAGNPLRLDTNQMFGYPDTGDLQWHVHSYAFAPGGEDICGAASTGGPWDPDDRMASANYSTACTNNPNALERWTECALGDLTGKLGNLRKRRFLDASSLRLIDLLGRSIVLHYADGTRFACANFAYVETPNEGACTSQPPASAFAARFVWPVAGQMLFRYYFSMQTQVAGYPAALSAHLYDVTGNPAQFNSNLAWTAHGNAVSFNDSLATDPAQRCIRAGPVLANGNMSDELNITLRIGATPAQGRQILPYSDRTVAYGVDIKSIVLWQNSMPVACAQLVPLPTVTATARFPNTGASSNYVRFSQASPLDIPTRIANISGASNAGSLGVRTAPVNVRGEALALACE